MASADDGSVGRVGGEGVGGEELGGDSSGGRLEEEANHVRWVFERAKEYLGGLRGVAKDEPKGVDLLKAAARGGLAEAQAKLGAAYSDGKYGTVEDIKKAVKWYRRAADQGHARAQCFLGACYLQGEGVNEDSVEAARLYRLSAEQGYVQAQFNLGVCYIQGEGVDQSYEEAVRWYRLAVDQGDADAQRNLAVLYYGGEGVKQDYAEAAQLLQLAADQDHKKSQAFLGLLYFEGHGVQRNCDTALQWLRRSGNAHRSVTDAIAQIEKSASLLLDKKKQAQRAMIEAGESVYGQTQDGMGDYALHVAAREMQAESVALLFDHPSFDALVLRKNAAGELPRDIVSACDPALAKSREARALRSILSVTRRTRAACILWCFEMLRMNAPERLVACIPRDIVCWEIVKHVLPPEAPGSLRCGVATLLCSPVAWPRPCLAIAAPVVPQPTSPAELLAMRQQQQQQQQGAVALKCTVAPQLQQPQQAQLLQQQPQAQPSTASDETFEPGTKRALEETGPVIIDTDDEIEEAVEPPSKRARF